MNKLREYIKKSSMTNRQIALKAGIDTSVIYNIVNNKKKDINFSTACKIADVLEVSLDEFRERND